MPSYKAPLRDMRFIVHELWNLPQFCQDTPYFQQVDPEIIDPILEEAAKVAENVLMPLNQSGDQEGVRFANGEITTPKGFKEAYQQLIAGGWMSLYADPQYGGQGLPKMLQILLDEMLASSNVAFSLYTVLTQGAYQALLLHANDAIKQLYLPYLVSGQWSGTMCLTEPHCGTDLGLLRTKAEPQSDDSYKLTGTKIFITSGEHDLTENILHAVLARTTDAPAGVKGISLFLVPKFLVNSDGSLGERNGVYCGSIEHKMGIKASSTCVMNFDGAIGYLIGEKNQGMKAMFSMMNAERLNIGLEGLALAETAYQNALTYAKERLQGRAATGVKYPDKMADPIIVHPDVRRMLLTIKAQNEAARALACWVANLIDIAKHHSDEAKRVQADGLVALLTPVIKAYFTDYGFDACNMALQILGGHGYVKEWGMEQYVRDVRIAQIYEGTNGVQALDLVKRKLIANRGEYVDQFSLYITEFIAQKRHETELSEFILPLENAQHLLRDSSDWIIAGAEKNPNEIGAGAYDYLHLLGLVALAFMWAKMADVAYAKLAISEQQEKSFYRAKIHTARFFYQRILPKITALNQAIHSGSDVIMVLDDNEF